MTELIKQLTDQKGKIEVEIAKKRVEISEMKSSLKSLDKAIKALQNDGQGKGKA